LQNGSGKNCLNGQFKSRLCAKKAQQLSSQALFRQFSFSESH
jgi:hypothetical protein